MYVNLEEEQEEEDFQTVSVDDEHWGMEEIPDRHLCIHDHSLPHGLCPYSDYQTSSDYNTFDLSDISKFEDLMTTSSNEDIPALNEILNGLWLEMNIYFYMNFKFYSCNITITPLH